MPASRTLGLALLTLALLSLVLVCGSPAADEIGSFDGAVWRFGMTPKGGGKKLRGAFRVNNHVLFQKSDRSDKDFTEKVGTNHPGARGKTRMVFNKEFQAVDEDKTRHEALGGVARLNMDEKGEWSGEYISEKGRHYEFRCTRIQE
jgi:hypothetical protein